MENYSYIINSGPGGTFTRSGRYQTKPMDVDNVFNQIIKAQPEKITLYFHGGLVSENTGIETALKLNPKLKTDKNFPLFLVWETGLLEIIQDKILDISLKKLFAVALKKVTQVMEKRLGFKSSNSKGGFNWLDDRAIEFELQKPIPFEFMEKEEEISARGAAASELPYDKFLLEGILQEDFGSLLENDHDIQLFLNDENSDGAKGLFNLASLIITLTEIGVRIIKRHQSGRDHGFFPTVVEEVCRQFYIADIGAEIWTGMKEKAESLWRSNQGINGDKQHAGSYLLDKIAAYALQRQDERNPVKINLVGHSAGSIVICELLKSIGKIYPSLVINQIILMAPACRTELFVDSVVKQPERYEKLYCFTMLDKNECQDILVKYFYTRSLLYFISGILEESGEGFDEYILGMERYLVDSPPYHKDENLKLIRNFFKTPKAELITSESLYSAPIGYRTTSLTHGDFDDNESTIESISYLLNSD